MDILVYDRADDRFKFLDNGVTSADKQIPVIENYTADPFMILDSPTCRIEVKDLGRNYKHLDRALSGIRLAEDLRAIYLRQDVYKTLDRVVQCGEHVKCLSLLRDIIIGYGGYGCMRWYYDPIIYRFTTHQLHEDSCIPVNITVNNDYVAKIIFADESGRHHRIFGKGDAQSLCAVLGTIKPHSKYEYSIIANKDFFDRCFLNRVEYLDLDLPMFKKYYERFEMMWTPWKVYFEQPARGSSIIQYHHTLDVDRIKALRAQFLGEQGEDEMGANKTNRCINGLRIKDVTFAKNKTTVVLWSDGVRTIVRCQKGEKFDPEKGLAMAISKRFLGNERSYYHTFLHWENKYNKTKKGKKSK